MSGFGEGASVTWTYHSSWCKAGAVSGSEVRLLVSSRLFLHGWPNRQQYRGSGERLLSTVGLSAWTPSKVSSRIFLLSWGFAKSFGSKRGVVRVWGSRSESFRMLRLNFMHGWPNRQQYLGLASGVGRADIMVKASVAAKRRLMSFMMDEDLIECDGRSRLYLKYVVLTTKED
jgi:hypothetical protein